MLCGIICAEENLQTNTREHERFGGRPRETLVNGAFHGVERPRQG